MRHPFDVGGIQARIQVFLPYGRRGSPGNHQQRDLHPPRSNIEPRTSRKRKKHLSEKDIDRLIDFGNKGKWGRWGKHSIVWLVVTKRTGLRPHEWRHAKLDEDRKLLIVENVKLTKTTGQSWPSRHVPVSHLSETDMKYLLAWMLVKMPKIKDDEEWNRMYDGCRFWLWWAQKQIWPKRTEMINIMSARHQFIADLKAGGFTPPEIAYLVGHGNDLRAFDTYGPSRHGDGGARLPDRSMIAEQDLLRIRKKLESKLTKREGPSAGADADMGA